MESWATASLSIRSFADLFSASRHPPPRDNTEVTSTKQPSAAEVEISGRSFHYLERMQPSHLQISEEHTLKWASTLLDAYGPSPQLGYEEYWDPARIDRRGPDIIISEKDTCSYFKISVLEPALTAAIFLHAQHMRLTAKRAGGYPRYNWAVRDRSIIGSSRRAGLSVMLSRSSNSPAVIADAKTSRTCRGTAADSVITMLSEWFQTLGDIIPMDSPDFPHSIRRIGTINTYDSPWQQKLQYFFFESWHQLLTNKCQYSILFNENEFILCRRTANGMLLSDAYPTASLEPALQKRAMTHLSYFIALAMCEPFWNPEPDTPIRSPPTIGVVVGNHNRSDEIIITEGGSRHLSTETTTAIPSDLILTTSGAPSPTCSLTVTHEDVSTSYLHSSLVILSSLIHEGHFSYVFRGQSGTTSIIGKLARNVSQANLRAEFLIYQRLSPLQGSVIPHYFGLFNVQNLGLLLLLEDCGQSIRTFDELSNRQKATLINHMFTIHKYGIRHGDLEPRNVVVSPAGKITVIDFEMSDQTHCCEDKKCAELNDLRNILQVDVERSVTTKTTGNGQDHAQPRYRYILLALAVILAGQYWL